MSTVASTHYAGYSPILAADALYTLWTFWFENMCHLITTQLMCFGRLYPSVCVIATSGYAITFLIVDRYEDIRWKLTRKFHRNDVTPWLRIAVALLLAVTSVTLLSGNVLVRGLANTTIPFCSLSIIFDSPLLAPILVPIIVLQACNSVVMSYVGRTNKLISERFAKQQEQQSLEYRVRLKRDIATSDTLTPIVMVMTGFYVVSITMYLHRANNR